MALALAAAGTAAPLTRLFYGDEDVLKLDRKLLERAYGAKAYVLKGEGKAPKRPKHLDGIVLHLDPEYDPDFVVGDRNPQVDWDRLKKKIDRNFPGIGDIDDKWHEYNFVRRIAPAMAPPRMELVASFSREPAGAAEAKAIAKAVGAASAAHPRAKVPKGIELAELEALRLHMHGEMGRSLIKVRLQNHSEGRLPKTDDDWLDIYLSYLEETAPKVAKIEKALEGTSVALQDEIFDLDFIEGRTLEIMLRHPKRVVVQQMVKIAKEARLHVVEGKVLEGATFLRFYPLGQYLSKADIAKLEGALTRGFLARLPEAYKKACFTSDLFIEEGTGKVRVLDLNTGIFSGYYFAEEDLITTNLLAERLTGKRTALLKELDGIYAAGLGKEKPARIREYRERYAKFLEGDVQESFWDRIFHHYVEVLGREPTPAKFAAVLADLEAAGLRTTFNYLQLFHWVQDLYPSARLSPAALEGWARKLHAWDRELFTWVDGDRLAFSEEAADRPKVKAKPRKKPRGWRRRWPKRRGTEKYQRDPE